MKTKVEQSKIHCYLKFNFFRWLQMIHYDGGGDGSDGGGDGGCGDGGGDGGG